MKVRLINFHCITDYVDHEIHNKKLLFVKAIFFDSDDFLDSLGLVEINTTKIGQWRYYGIHK